MKSLFICFFVFVSIGVQAQITLIPDSAFETLLINTGVDTDGVLNGQVATSDIEDELVLLLDYPDIQDLTGLEDFTSLKDLTLFGVNVTEVDLSQNSDLEEFEVNTAPLEGLDLSQNLNLRNLIFVGGHNCASCPFSSPISSLDLSNNLLLEDIIIAWSLITTIDLSINTMLDRGEFWFNSDLTSLNLKNGNNENIYYLVINDNPNLACIQVDDPAAVIAGVDPPYDNWTISGSPLISEDCFLGLDEVNLESSLVIYPNPVKDQIFIESNFSIEIESLQIYSLLGELVMSRQGKTHQIDVSKLRSGVYFLKVSTSRGEFTKKLLKK